MLGTPWSFSIMQLYIVKHTFLAPLPPPNLLAPPAPPGAPSAPAPPPPSPLAFGKWAMQDLVSCVCVCILCYTHANQSTLTVMTVMTVWVKAMSGRTVLISLQPRPHSSPVHLIFVLLKIVTPT